MHLQLCLHAWAARRRQQIPRSPNEQSSRSCNGCAELALGRFFQRGNVMAFGMIHKRVRGVGAISVLGGFGIVCFYSVIISWCDAHCIGGVQQATVLELVLHSGKSLNSILLRLGVVMAAASPSVLSCTLASGMQQATLACLQKPSLSCSTLHTFYGPSRTCALLWCRALYFLGASFKWPLPWAAQACPPGDADCRAEPRRMLPLQASNTYFTDTVLKSNRDNLDRGVAENISGPLYGSALPHH